MRGFFLLTEKADPITGQFFFLSQTRWRVTSYACPPGSTITAPASRAALYYRAVKTGVYELALMALIDRQYLQTPFYGSWRMAAWLQAQGHAAVRKRVQRLMQWMGLAAIYQRPRTSRPAPEHRIYPYLLRGLRIERVGQVWAADITYIPMARGFLYLVAVMDWVSRYVLAWCLSNLLDASFCIEALERSASQF
jgi:putative transposase